MNIQIFHEIQDHKYHHSFKKSMNVKKVNFQYFLPHLELEEHVRSEKGPTKYVG